MTLDELNNEIDIDIKGSLVRFGNMENFYIKYLKKFIEDKSFEILFDGINEDNREKIEEGAHTLKGVAGNLGLIKIYSISVELMKAQLLSEKEILALYEELKEELVKTREVLKKLD